MTQVLGASSAAATTTVTPITPAVAPASSRVYETPLAPEPAWPEPAWEDEESKKRSVWRWLVPLLIVLVLAGLAAWFLLAEQGEPVPDVAGMTVAQATQELTDAGFQVGDTRKDYSEDVAKSRVIETEPPAGDEADLDTPITLVVSEGPPPTDVPDVVGKPRNTAVNLLKQAGFTPAFGEPENSDTVKAGLVIRQDPPAGQEQQPGATVTLILSSGKEKLDVPDVTGQTFEEAKALLEGEDYGFVVVRSDVDSSQPEGIVVSQSPNSDAELAAGQKITLSVATGQNQVPGVVGSSQAEAEAALDKAGFQANVTFEPTDDASQFDQVLSQDPGAEADLQVGSTVDIVVGQESGDIVPTEPPRRARGHAFGRR
jgi:serine/threonine-protein kinase